MIGFEICQKLIYMIRDNQIESEWHPSVYAALDGIAGVVGGIEDNEIGAAIAELVIKDLLQSMVTGKDPRTKNGRPSEVQAGRNRNYRYVNSWL